MHTRVQTGSLQVAKSLADFVNTELLPVVDLTPEAFWHGLERLIDQFSPRNSQLLAIRDALQEHIDQWHQEHRESHDAVQYQDFLESIGYLVPPGPAFTIATAGVDPEITVQAGPQLVVPVKNARFALNAANARWGSLYDALYGTDAIAESDGADRTDQYNPVRGKAVIDFVRVFLDQVCPLQTGSHRDVEKYFVRKGKFVARLPHTETELQAAACFAGYCGDQDAPTSLLLVHNNLHIEIRINANTSIGRSDKAGVSDVVLEAAITTIQDCEDSVAAVDADDKVEVYRNYLGLITGELQAEFVKNESVLVRKLEEDRHYLSPEGKPFQLSGRSLLLVRNVGLLMRNPAILDRHDMPVFEGILDTVITCTIGAIDTKRKSRPGNSRTGSIYIVKPKLHGPEEVKFTVDLFEQVEDLLELPRNTVKIGIMDEERRTTLNLKECIRVARDRVVFINTGFLDRTGDEIHTSMHAGPVVPKPDMKHATWIGAYENNNVDTGLSCGFGGRAQIGKGMWAMPDLMAQMLKDKIAHPLSGANTAWVPSPTAAVLHAMHYHHVDVAAQQQKLESRKPVPLSSLLTLPLLSNPDTLTSTDVQSELDNNVQGILGYVVRWINNGVGCSKVPDIHNVGLMEDRATLRISSQLLANWLMHGLCSRQQVMDTLQRMALVVDQQNAGDADYIPMAPDFGSSRAFQAACELIFDGYRQPNGYTEPILHKHRLLFKRTAGER